MIFNVLKFVLFIIIMFGMHEGGHFIYAKYKKCNPIFRIRYFGLWLEVGGFWEHLTFVEKFNLHFWGVALGYVPVLIVFYKNGLWLATLIYAGISSMDLLIMFFTIIAITRYGNRKVVDRFSLVGS